MRNSLTMVLSGEAGQGLQTIEEYIVEAASKSYYVFSTKEVMSRVRGGNNTLEIRIGQKPIGAYKHAIDLLFLLNDHAAERLADRITRQTIVLGEESFAKAIKVDGEGPIVESFKLKELSTEAGGSIFANSILFGLIAGLLDLVQDDCHAQIAAKFSNDLNKIEAHKKAFDVGFARRKVFVFDLKVQHSERAKGYKILDGSSAVGIGALAGGCNFVASYPMSPGTGLLTYMAGKALDFGVLVEQAEDEIAALNMVIGAWYAGARGLATTSGGGFSLMQEAVSLSGMTETPCVIHIGQRPGPATGLPTRTEQADLNLAVYAGHGEFPRIVFAPGNLKDAVLLTQKAFYVADKYQIPVIILTDQFLLDSYAQLEQTKLEAGSMESFVVKTASDYKRYQLTPNGISPRGIPGKGQGFVKVDSDEHDEYGMITEDFDMRIHMQDKRMKKGQLLLEDYAEAELIGAADYQKLVVGWGSTYGVIKEYMETSADKETAYLYIKQLYPLHPAIGDYINKAKVTVCVENNATGQLARLLKTELNCTINHQILKYNGAPFSIEEIDHKLGEVL